MSVKSRIALLVEAQGARRAASDVDRVTKSTRGLGDETKRTTKHTDEQTRSTDDFHKKLVELDKTLNGKGVIEGLKKLLKPAAILTGLGVAAQGISALAAGGVALGGALAPAAGLLAAYPALGSAAAQSLGVVKLATGGVTEVVGGLNDNLDTSSKQFKKLTPEAQRFARTLERLKAPLRPLAGIAQRGLLPGLTDGLKTASKNIGVLRSITGGTARTLGDLASRAGALLGSKGFGADLERQGKRNDVSISRLGRAGIYLVDALRHVTIAAGPLVGWLTKLILGWSKSADAAARAGRENGKLAGFFNRTRIAMTHLLSIGHSLATAFSNIGKAGAPLGRGLLAVIDKNAAAFARWTNSAKGQNSIARFFQRARAPIMAIGRLIRDVVVDFARMGGNTSGLAGMIDQLRTQLLPILVRVTTTTTNAFGPHLVDAIVAFAHAFEPFLGSSGPLVLLLQGMTLFARVTANLEQMIPGAGAALSVLAGGFAVLQAVGLASFAGSMFGAGRGITAVKRAATGASAAIKTMRGWCIGTRIQLAALKVQEIAVAVATRIAAAATKAWSAAQWLLNAALDANPIGIAVVAITALAVALVLAYRRSDRFRSIVQATFGWIKDHWPLLLGIIAPISIPIIALIRHFNAVKKAGVGAFNAIKDTITSAVRYMTDRLRDFLGFLDRAKDKIASIPGVKQALDVGKTAAGAATGLLGGLKNATGLATGGVVDRAGLSWVGERGPELLWLPQSAEVTRHEESRRAVQPLARTSSPGVTRLHPDDLRWLAEMINDKQVVLDPHDVAGASRRIDRNRRLAAAPD